MKRLLLLCLLPLAVAADPLPQSEVEERYTGATRCARFAMTFPVIEREAIHAARGYWMEALRQYRPVDGLDDFIYGDHYLTAAETHALHDQEAGPELLARYRWIVAYCQSLIDTTPD